MNTDDQNAAAVFNATGAFVTEIPITPERLQSAMEKTKPQMNTDEQNAAAVF